MKNPFVFILLVVGILITSLACKRHHEGWSETRAVKTDIGNPDLENAGEYLQVEEHSFRIEVFSTDILTLHQPGTQPRPGYVMNEWLVMRGCPLGRCNFEGDRYYPMVWLLKPLSETTDTPLKVIQDVFILNANIPSVGGSNNQRPHYQQLRLLRGVHIYPLGTRLEFFEFPDQIPSL